MLWILLVLTPPWAPWASTAARCILRKGPESPECPALVPCAEWLAGSACGIFREAAAGWGPCRSGEVALASCARSRLYQASLRLRGRGGQDAGAGGITGADWLSGPAWVVAHGQGLRCYPRKNQGLSSLFPASPHSTQPHVFRLSLWQQIGLLRQVTKSKCYSLGTEQGKHLSRSVNKLFPVARLGGSHL